MHKHHENSHNADVVAVFDNQDDVDDAILHLRLNGFKDRQIGYFMRHPDSGLTDLYDRSYAGVGVVLGSIVGAALGLGLAWYLNQWSESFRNVTDFFGLASTFMLFGALFGGFIGWGCGVGVHRTGVEAPNFDPTVGPYVVAIHAGAAQDRASSILHRYGGHDMPPGAMMARPATV